MPRQVGVEHDAPSLGSRPNLPRQRADHRRQAEHEHAAVRVGIERSAVVLDPGRQPVDAAGDLGGEPGGWHVERGDRVQLHEKIAAEVQRQRRRLERLAEQVVDRAGEPAERPGQRRPPRTDQGVGRPQERQVTIDVEHADERLQIPRQRRLECRAARTRIAPLTREGGRLVDDPGDERLAARLPITGRPERHLLGHRGPRRDDEHAAVHRGWHPQRERRRVVDCLAPHLDRGRLAPSLASGSLVGGSGPPLHEPHRVTADDLVGAADLPAGLDELDRGHVAAAERHEPRHSRLHGRPQRSEKQPPLVVAGDLAEAGQQDQLRSRGQVGERGGPSRGGRRPRQRVVVDHDLPGPFRRRCRRGDSR